VILSNVDVENLLRRGVIKITPKPEQEQIGPGSVDLTLSNEFWRFKGKAKGKEFDLDEINLEEITEKIVTDRIVLEPGELILGKTVERITLPDNICGHLEGRSRYARRGLVIHATSSFIQPGSDNRQLLEIVNLAPYKIVLRAGIRCTQVIFDEMKTPTNKPYRKVGIVARTQ
jgi:dCTP deaminase